MNVLYDSRHFYVAEYPGQQGIELVDKAAGRGAFLKGDVAEKLRSSMHELLCDQPTVDTVDDLLESYHALLVETVDDLLESYDALLNNPVTLH